MAQVNSKVVINQSVIKRLSKAASKALEMTGEALHTEIGQAQVVPMDKGTLSGEAFFCDYSESSKGTVKLIHSTPYARRLYFHPEYHFSKEEHADAKGEWFKDWADGGRYEKFTSKAYSKFYKEIAGT